MCRCESYVVSIIPRAKRKTVRCSSRLVGDFSPGGRRECFSLNRPPKHKLTDVETNHAFGKSKSMSRKLSKFILLSKKYWRHKKMKDTEIISLILRYIYKFTPYATLRYILLAYLSRKSHYGVCSSRCNEKVKLPLIFLSRSYRKCARKSSGLQFNATSQENTNSEEILPFRNIFETTCALYVG